MKSWLRQSIKGAVITREENAVLNKRIGSICHRGQMRATLWREPRRGNCFLRNGRDYCVTARHNLRANCVSVRYRGKRFSA